MTGIIFRPEEIVNWLFNNIDNRTHKNNKPRMLDIGHHEIIYSGRPPTVENPMDKIIFDDGLLNIKKDMPAVNRMNHVSEKFLWALWRQDNNGHRFLISVRQTSSEAEEEKRLYERLRHKQFYWVEPYKI